jgi:tetratricopeptide (TPR) repeat protein/predicted Ser/Thr protein kinase
MAPPPGRSTPGSAEADRAESPESVASDPPDSSVGAMAKVTPEAPAGELLARARMMGALFGRDRAGGAFGRFHVLNRLGAGGMGVVYEAYDPDLARGVALKLVDVAQRDREAALAEARILARLSHPNIVPIYDVGLTGDHVYIVMELVRGRTLDQWPDGTGRRDVLAAYHQAGAALAAAHRASIVHRDFKPGNAIIGADGRVRVLDFGLACEADAPGEAAPRGAAGTRGFMAPEIVAGAAVTPAADQYSFCVALARSLEPTGEPPRWIARALARGRSDEPAARYPSMELLLHDLARDPARRRRRAGVAAGVLLAFGAVVFAAGQRTRERSDELAACDDTAREIETSWPRAERDAALARVAGLTGDGAAIRARLARDLDGYAMRWTKESRAACRDRVSRAWADEPSAHRLACLRRGVRTWQDVGREIAGAPADKLAAIQVAVLSMTDPARCSDDALSFATVEQPPPGQVPAIERVRDRLERARSQLDLGRDDRAVSEAAAAVGDARALAYRPLLAESLLVEGQARMSRRDGSSVDALREASAVAVRARMDATAIEAWSRWAFAKGTSDSPGGAVVDAEFMRGLAERTPSGEFARALLYNNLGGVALVGEDRAHAAAYFREAEALAPMIGGYRDRRRLELLASRVNLGALALDDRAAGDRLVAETEREWTALLGPDHPRTREARWMRAMTTLESLRDALGLLAPLCEAFERSVVREDRAARCWVEAGLLDLDLDRLDDARTAFLRAAGPYITPPALAAAYVAMFGRDQPEVAAAALQHELDIASPADPGAPWWKRASRAELSLALGRALAAQGRFGDARASLETAVSLSEAIVKLHPGTQRERVLGRARVQLARVLMVLHAAPDEFAAAAKPAVDWLRRVGGDPSQIAELSR